MLARETVCGQLRGAFQAHGALPLNPPLLYPRRRSHRSAGGEESGENRHSLGSDGFSQDLLDTDGIVVSLPVDLITPFARYVALAGMTHVKRYQLARIFRRSEDGGHPWEELSAQYDSVYDAHDVIAEVIEAETIWVACQAMKGLSSHLGPYFIRLNNTYLTSGLFDILEVPAAAKKDVLRVLELASSRLTVSSKQISQLMEGIKELPRNVMDRLRLLALNLNRTDGHVMAFLDTVESWVSSLPVVKSILGVERGESIHISRREQKRIRQACKTIFEALASTRTLLQCLQALGISQYYQEAESDGVNGRTRSDSLSISPTTGGVPDPNLKLWFTPRSDPYFGPQRIQLDLGLSKRKGPYNSGMVFQVILQPKEREGDENAGSENMTLSLSRETSAHKVATHYLQYRRWCVAEGGRCVLWPKIVCLSYQKDYANSLTSLITWQV